MTYAHIIYIHVCIHIHIYVYVRMYVSHTHTLARPSLSCGGACKPNGCRGRPSLPASIATRGSHFRPVPEVAVVIRPARSSKRRRSSFRYSMAEPLPSLFPSEARRFRARFARYSPDPTQSCWTVAPVSALRLFPSTLRVRSRAGTVGVGTRGSPEGVGKRTGRGSGFVGGASPA